MARTSTPPKKFLATVDTPHNPCITRHTNEPRVRITSVTHDIHPCVEVTANEPDSGPFAGHVIFGLSLHRDTKERGNLGTIRVLPDGTALQTSPSALPQVHNLSQAEGAIAALSAALKVLMLNRDAMLLIDDSAWEQARAALKLAADEAIPPSRAELRAASASGEVLTISRSGVPGDCWILRLQGRKVGVVWPPGTGSPRGARSYRVAAIAPDGTYTEIGSQGGRHTDDSTAEAFIRDLTPTIIAAARGLWNPTTGAN